MPHFFSPPQCLEEGGHSPQSQSATFPKRMASSLERKIHPNINLLAETLESSLTRVGEDDPKGLRVLQMPSEPSDAGFEGVKQSTRRRRYYNEMLEDNTLDSHESYYHRKTPGPRKDTRINPSLPTEPLSREYLHFARSTSMKWKDVRRRSRSQKGKEEDTKGDEQVHDSKVSSQSSPETLQSADTHHSRLNSFGSTSRVLQTPESKTGTSYCPNHTHATSSAVVMSSLPSPHIFGTHLPVNSQETSQDAEYFDSKETPPPLPPLNHPAFRNPPRSFNFPDLPALQDFGGDIESLPASRKTAHSLPSLRHSKSRKARIDLNDIQQASASQLGTRGRLDPSSSAKLHQHSRQQSKSSIATFTSSRRSSADYSANQVSLIADDIHGLQEGSWEVEVSKAMVNLALSREQRVETRSENQDAHLSYFGSRKARGRNRASGGESGLGSPFLLKDSPITNIGRRSDNFAESPSFGNYADCTHTTTDLHTSSTVKGKNQSRSTDMTNGESILRHTGSSAKPANGNGKDKEVTESGSILTGSKSRRTGRTLSGPSSTLEPARLDQASATPQSLLSSSTTRRGHHKSTPTMPTSSVLKTPSTPLRIEKSYSSGSGKRKADEAGVSGDKTPPKESREARTTFAPEPRPHRASATSGVSTHAPSSFNRSKRVRLTETPEGRASSRAVSRSGSLTTPNESPPNAKNTGSWSSRGSYAMSHSSHYHGHRPPTSASQASNPHQHRAPSRTSLSQASIPISALISPHAPSIGRLSTFHMRDPRKPNPVRSTTWTLSFPSTQDPDQSRWSSRNWIERGGSPIHAWLFFIGFIIFPLWWAAALFVPIPRTRTLNGGENTDAEKGVLLDDPQLEHDAKSWRTRCRVMAGVSLLTYIPFIVLVAIFA